MAKLVRAIVVAAFCCAVTTFALAADVTGVWTASFDTQLGNPIPTSSTSKA